MLARDIMNRNTHRDNRNVSTETAKLLGLKPRRKSDWIERLATIADRLVAAYGVPSLGNFRDPVKEIFYILLSAKTTDAQYRRTHRQLYGRFRRLQELANAPVAGIRSCIRSGGLAVKRAVQIKSAAKALIAQYGNRSSARLRRLSSREAFDFISALPGMGPKSALCVLMYSFDVDVFPVDANVQRIAERLGAIPKGLKHYQALRRLAHFAPKGRCRELHIGMVVLGRKVCLPKTPKCSECFLRDMCRHGRRVVSEEGYSNGA